jgi:hypothetical protein
MNVRENLTGLGVTGRILLNRIINNRFVVVCDKLYCLG